MKAADPDLFAVLADGRIRCNVCEIRCVLKEGDRGFCQTRLVQNGTLYTLIYGTSSGVCADPIEKKPLNHFHPGTLVLSAGTRGCNFHCPGCQNWHISHDHPDMEASNLSPFSPESSVNLALRNQCSGIAWTYNDPSIWFEHTYDTAQLAKQKGLYTVYVTNGYSTPEALDKIAPYLDAFRVDIKAFSRQSYRRISGIGKWETIPRLTERALKVHNIHVEVVTNLTPTINDSEKEIRDLANWIATGLGPDIPWHVTRFFPHLELSHLPPTPIGKLEQAIAIGHEEGLKYVYIGNLPGHPAQNTYCPGCGQLLIQREGYHTRIAGLREGKCSRCQHLVYGVWDNDHDSALS